MSFRQWYESIFSLPVDAGDGIPASEFPTKWPGGLNRGAMATWDLDGLPGQNKKLKRIRSFFDKLRPSQMKKN